MMPHNRAATLIIDPHGEYNTLQEMQNLPAFRDGNYKPTGAHLSTGHDPRAH